MMPDLPNVGFERDIEQFVVSLVFLIKKSKLFLLNDPIVIF